MTPLLFFPKLLIAGGSSFLGTLQLPQEFPLDNHTLAGEKIPAVQVVTRSHWGTPMLPDSKGGYSLIAPIKKELIEQSLWIPPVSGTRPVVEAPLPPPTQPAATAVSAAPTVSTAPTVSAQTNVPAVPAPTDAAPAATPASTPASSTDSSTPTVIPAPGT